MMSWLSLKKRLCSYTLKENQCHSISYFSTRLIRCGFIILPRYPLRKSWIRSQYVLQKPSSFTWCWRSKLLTPFYIFLEMLDSKQQQLDFMWAASGTISTTWEYIGCSGWSLLLSYYLSTLKEKEQNASPDYNTLKRRSTTKNRSCGSYSPTQHSFVPDWSVMRECFK